MGAQEGREAAGRGRTRREAERKLRFLQSRGFPHLLLSSSFSRPFKVMLWALGHDAAPERGFGQGATDRACGSRKGLGRKQGALRGVALPERQAADPPQDPHPDSGSQPRLPPRGAGRGCLLGDRSSSAPLPISPGGTWRLPLRLASEHRAVAATTQAVRERRCSTSGVLNGTKVVPQPLGHRGRPAHLHNALGKGRVGSGEPVYVMKLDPTLSGVNPRTVA